MRILGKTLKVSKKGVLKVTVANPNDFRLKGKVSLKAGRLKVGSKAFSIGAAKRSGTVRIKLSRRAFRTLKRRRRMAVTATVTGRGPIGKSRTLRKKLSIKAPPRPKKRRRRTGGGGGGLGGQNPCGTPVFEPGTNNYNPLTGQYEFTPGRLNYCPGLY